MEQGKPLSATERPLDYDAVCLNIRAAIDTVRVHAVSLHDEKGDLLWMTESSMGPDEHNAVREAFEVFLSPNGRPVMAYDLGDFRSAVLFRAVNVRRTMVGAIMVVLDTRGLQQDNKGVARLMTPKLQRVVYEFAGMRTAAAPPAGRAIPATSGVGQTAIGDSPPPFEITLADSMRTRKPVITSEDSPQPPASPPPNAARAQAVNPPHSRIPQPAIRLPKARGPMPSTGAPQAGAPSQKRRPQPASTGSHSGTPVLASIASAVGAPARARTATKTGTPSPDGRATASASARRPLPVTPEIDNLHASLRRAPIALCVQRLVPLSNGTQLNRYEVLLRSNANGSTNVAPQAMLETAVKSGLGSMIDRRVLTELISWLVRHPAVWKDSASMFSVNLTSTALHDDHFIKFVGLCLAKSSLPAAMIAFEIDVSTAIKLSDKVAEVAAALNRLGCPLVLDDFGMRTECFDLLRLPGVRYVKLATDITEKMRADKLSQAAITAVVQMARVLGMHTVAKRTETAGEREWLTALGVDFVQSNELSPAAAIDSLLQVARAKT